MAFAAPKPEDRLAFADELAQVRAALAAAKKQVEKNVYREYKKELNEIEVEYQFTLLRSLDLFHKEMLRAKLPDRLYEIKENLTDTAGRSHIKSTFQTPTGIGTTSYVNNATKRA